jgi:hypothetical protein
MVLFPTSVRPAIFRSLPVLTASPHTRKTAIFVQIAQM